MAIVMDRREQPETKPRFSSPIPTEAVEIGDKKAGWSPERLMDAIPTSLAAGVGLAWLVLYSLGLALEPAPANPAAAPAALVTLLATVFTIGVLTAAVG